MNAIHGWILVLIYADGSRGWLSQVIAETAFVVRVRVDNMLPEGK